MSPSGRFLIAYPAEYDPGRVKTQNRASEIVSQLEETFINAAVLLITY